MSDIPHTELIQQIMELRDLKAESFLLFEVALSENIEAILELHDALLHVFQDTPARILITPGHIVESVHALGLDEMLELREALDYAIAVAAKTSTAAEA